MYLFNQENLISIKDNIKGRQRRLTLHYFCSCPTVCFYQKGFFHLKYILYVKHSHIIDVKKSTGLLWWLSGKESVCQCRTHGFNSWSEKLPHAVEQLSPCVATTEPVLWSLGAATVEWLKYKNKTKILTIYQMLVSIQSIWDSHTLLVGI